MALSSGAPVSPIDTLKEAEFRLTVIVVHAGDKVHDSFRSRSNRPPTTPWRVSLPGRGGKSFRKVRRAARMIGRVTMKKRRSKEIP
jgi:hypothetical protein